MSCIHPPELSTLQLLMAADGEASPEVQRHLAACPHCRQRAAELAQWQQRLSERLFRATCPSSLELGEYRLGLLRSAQAAEIARHLNDCPHCAAELAQWDQFAAQEPQVDRLAPIKQQVQVLVARLVSGGRSMGALFAPQPVLAPAFAGLRGGNEEPLVYEAGDVQLTIEVETNAAQPGQFSLVGLVLGLAEPGLARINLWRDDRPLAEIAVDDLGNFTIPGLTAARYELILTAPDSEIHVQDLTVG